MLRISILTVLLLAASYAEAKSKIAFKEAVSVHLKLSGDLTADYDLDGPLGSEIEAAGSKTDSVCAVKATFRKSLYRATVSLETWLRLDCTFEGQKRTYRPHRIFLDLAKAEQKVQLPMLAKNLKNVRLEFQNLSLVKGK